MPRGSYPCVRNERVRRNPTDNAVQSSVKRALALNIENRTNGPIRTQSPITFCLRRDLETRKHVLENVGWLSPDRKHSSTFNEIGQQSAVTMACRSRQRSIIGFKDHPYTVQACRRVQEIVIRSYCRGGPRPPAISLVQAEFVAPERRHPKFTSLVYPRPSITLLLPSTLCFPLPLLLSTSSTITLQSPSFRA